MIRHFTVLKIFNKIKRKAWLSLFILLDLVFYTGCNAVCQAAEKNVLPCFAVFEFGAAVFWDKARKSVLFDRWFNYVCCEKPAISALITAEKT